jgi:hypothetical protein
MGTKSASYFIAGILFATAVKQAFAITYQTIDYPGSSSTRPHAIDGEKIVGEYHVASGSPHGFIYDGTTYTSFDNPLSANGTQPGGISGGNIIGFYQDSAGKDHGFLYDGASFITLDL